MNEGNYILLNGSFIPASEYRFSHQESEGFLFSEQFRSIRSAFPFFDKTLEIICMKLQLYSQSFPELTNNQGAELKRQMERTLTKNKQFLGSILTICFWISDQVIQYSIQTTRIKDTEYELNSKGLHISIFPNILKSVSSISNISLGSEVFWKIAESHRKTTLFDQYFLLNTEDQITEAIKSNVYLIKNGIVKGVSIHLGAYADVTKPLMLDIFRKLKLVYSEEDGITENDILEADEIFLVNAIEGIQWIVGFAGKRYFNQTTRKIHDLFSRSFDS